MCHFNSVAAFNTVDHLVLLISYKMRLWFRVQSFKGSLSTYPIITKKYFSAAPSCQMWSSSRIHLWALYTCSFGSYFLHNVSFHFYADLYSLESRWPLICYVISERLQEKLKCCIVSVFNQKSEIVIFAHSKSLCTPCFPIDNPDSLWKI